MGVEAPRVVFGHTHLQFTRTGPGDIELVNPGSVGMPWDGDHRAAYAVLDGDRLEQRRVEYDWQASARGRQGARGRAAGAPDRAGPVRRGLVLASGPCDWPTS